MQVVLLLIEHNALLDPWDAAGNTPLHWACTNGHMETAALLLMVRQIGESALGVKQFYILITGHALES